MRNSNHLGYLNKLLFFVVCGLCLGLAACRCSFDPGEDEDENENQQPIVSGTGEKLVQRKGTVRPNPPPRLPGEKRRRTGEAPYSEPSEPDPLDGQFSLRQATEGLEGSGSLVAEIATDFGLIRCDLYASKAPNTVANFVGLARGKRPWWNPYGGQWTDRPFYNGLTFHKVIPGSFVQGGSPTGSAEDGPGFEIDDEIDESLSHDRAGILTMYNQGSNTGGSQFMILDGPAPHLNGRQTVFGHCEPDMLIGRLARVPQTDGNRPLTNLLIRSIRIVRDN